MAIAYTNLSSNSNNDSTSVTSSSITNTANSLVLATVVQRTGITADPNTPTLSGLSLTWVQVATILYDTTSSSRRRVTVFRALGASASGTVVADFGGQSSTHSAIIISEFSGVDTSGTNGSGAIVQSATNKDESGTATTVVATLAAFGSANNATFGAFGGAGSQVTTAGSGFGDLLQVSNGGAVDVSTQWRVDNDTTVDITWAGSQTNCGGIGIEIKQAGGASTSVKDIIGSGFIPFAR